MRILHMTNRQFLTVALCSVVMATPAAALDLAYAFTGSAGAAMAFGGGLPAALAEFGGSGALYAPVFGAAVGVGINMELAGPLRASAGLEARRLGYAFWAPEISASTWLALWAAGLRLGLGFELDAWRFGAGASVLAPASGISQATSQGGAGLTVAYDISAGLFPILGGYLEASLGLGPRLALGTLSATPAAGFALGVWPTGIVDSVRAWQASADIFVTLHLEKRTAR